MSRNKKMLIIIIPQIVLLAILLNFNQIHYATNDDTTMVAIASGAYGKPSEYIINMNMVIGWILKFLFSNFPIINWMTILFLIFHSVSFLFIDLIFVENANVDKVHFSLEAVILWLSYFITLNYFTFTVISSVLGFAGCIYLISTLYNFKIKNIIIGFSFVILSIMVRVDSIITLMIVIIPYIGYYSIKYKKKLGLILIITLPVLWLSITQLDRAINNQSPIQKSFFEWGEARSKALDTKAIDYGKHIEDFSSIGYYADEYNAVYSAFYYDRSIFTAESFEKMATFNSAFEKYNFDVAGFFENYSFKVNNFNLFPNIFYVVFVITSLFSIIVREKDKLGNIIISFLTLGVCFIFYFINRSPYHIEMPAVIFGLLLLTYVNLDIRLDKRYQVEYKNKRYIFKLSYIIYAFAIFILFNAFYSYCFNNSFKSRNEICYNEKNLKVIKYLEENENNLYVVGHPAILSLDVARNIFDFSGRNSRWNIIGNWEIYSVPYYNLMKYYNVTDPDRVILDLAEDKGIYVMTNFNTTMPDYIINLVEKQTNKKVIYTKTDEILDTGYGDWYIYKLSYDEGINNG